MTSSSASSSGRAWRALGLALAVLGAALAVALVTRRSGGDASAERRFVRTSAPDQVSAPGRAPRDPPAKQLAVGERAPRLVLPDLASGTMRDLAAWRGRPVVLNVWASWCPPCVREMPSLRELHRGADGRFAVVTVSVDEDRPAARALVDRFDLDFPVLLDAGGERLAAWGTVMYPETWILDAEGRVAERIVGEADWTSASVRARLRALESSPDGESP